MFTKKDFIKYCNYIDEINQTINELNNKEIEAWQKENESRQKGFGKLFYSPLHIEFPRLNERLSPTLDGFLQYMKSQLTQ